MRKILFLVFLFHLISACAASPVQTEKPKGCDEPDERIKLVDQSLPILVGELHGTYEYPRFIRHIACSLLPARKPVLIGLEFPTSEQPLINTFLSSKGSPAAEKKLLAGKFWNETMRDGRSSQAMFDLIEFIRLARAAGFDALVFAFDVDSILTMDNLDDSDRDLS